MEEKMIKDDVTTFFENSEFRFKKTTPEVTLICSKYMMLGPFDEPYVQIVKTVYPSTDCIESAIEKYMV